MAASETATLEAEAFLARIESLHFQGFDLSYYDEPAHECRTFCSACVAVVIDGVPLHQQSCPRAALAEGFSKVVSLRA